MLKQQGSHAPSCELVPEVQPEYAAGGSVADDYPATIRNPDTPTQIERYLACPRCFGVIEARDGAISCRAPHCGWRGAVSAGIAVMTEDGRQPSYFDDKTGEMRLGCHGEGTSAMFYERQARLVEDQLRPHTTVLDVGCGPVLPYKRRDDCVVIGVDLSWQSLCENSQPDLRVYASADRLPVPSHSIDTIVCMYSIHHFAGVTAAQNRRIVRTAFGEFARVLKPGGVLLVCEVAPRWVFAVVQTAAWDIAKHFLGPRLDMFFWTSDQLRELASQAFAQSAVFSVERFDSSWWTTFPPIFALPQLRIPRLFYPFDIVLYRWRLQ